MAAQFEVAELTTGQSEVWDRLLSGSPQATIFCSPQFSRALAEATGQAYRFVVCFREDRLIAGIPLFEWRRAGILMVRQPPLVPHLGLIVSGDVEADHPRSREFNVLQACRALSEWLAERYDYVSFSHHPSLTDVRPFLWQGFREKACYTYRIRLARFGPDMLHSSTRNKIAKARREHVQIEESEDLTHILVMVEMSYARRGRKVPFSKRYLETLFRCLARHGLVRLHYARNSEGKVVSGRIILESFDVVYDWVAGADPVHYGSAATPFLLYTIIEKSRKGHDIYDLMGANTPSIAAFKSNFGGEIAPYYLTSKTVSIKGSLALFSREILKRWRRM
ncbi:MAG: GNAT family N-acetyltransferase [bacterium]